MKVVPYIAYKATDPKMQCQRSFQFELGKTYSMVEPVENPRLCSSDGFHYCDKLEQVFSYYPPALPGTLVKNRYFEVEILGFVDNPSDNPRTEDKRVTTSLKFVREITEEEINDALDRQKIRLEEESMCLDVIRELQEKHPEIIVTGSIALFLHGINLKRFKKDGATDIDLVIPYYIKIGDEKSQETEITKYEDNEVNLNALNNSFDFSVETEGGIITDVSINNKEKYTYITRNGFKYKVALVERVLAAKCEYALKGQKKHQDDIKEMLGLTK